MSRPVAAAAAALATLAVLAGCGGPTEPSPPPTSQDALTTATAQPDDVEETTEAVTSQPDETAAETETEAAEEPPEMPAAAREQTEAGAEAFVEHYIDALDYAYATGGVAHMDELASPECQSCDALLTDLPSNPDASPTFALDEVQGEVLGAGLARVEANVSVLRGSGEGQGMLTFDLSEQDSGWVIDGIRLQENP